LKPGDFQVASCDLTLQLLLTGLGLVEFLAGGQGALVYGGNESKGDHMDGFIDVGVGAKEHFCSLWRDWGKFLFSFLVGNREAEGWGFIGSIDDGMW